MTRPTKKSKWGEKSNEIIFRNPEEYTGLKQKLEIALTA